MNNIGEKIIRGCFTAYRIGTNQTSKKRLKRQELLDRVDWVRGIHYNLMWEAYKSGLYEKDNDNTSG